MELKRLMKDAGIIGAGGAGFPSYAKLAEGADTLLINGAECEPLLRTDRYIMRNKAPELIKAIQALAEELHIPHCVIATKHHYSEEIAALREAITEANADIKVHELESFYPAGDEQTIVHEVTGQTVPPAGLPIAVGAVVDNIATVYAIAEAMADIPFTQKYLTVTGEVRHPVILNVPVGTSLRECIAMAGGALSEDYFVVTGGPMMGRPVPKEMLDSAVVTKTTSAILVLPADGQHARAHQTSIRHMLNRARSACIQCTSCTQLCPRHLLGHPLEPHRIMRKMSTGGELSTMLEDPQLQNALLCCECGVCETYACPMGLQPRKINAMIKQEFAKAGVRYQVEENFVCKTVPERENRKIPSEKLAARAGVHKYYDYEITELLIADPGRVEIPLKMHIGAPAQAVVSEGNYVTKGDVLAYVPEHAMGAAIHASISGYVERVDERIVIVKR